MMDALSLLVGAGLLVVGTLAGFLAGRRGRRREPQPVCGCGHHRSMHGDGGAGGCMATVDTEPRFNAAGVFIGSRPVGCACQQYIGPEPITALWTPPVLDQESCR